MVKRFFSLYLVLLLPVLGLLGAAIRTPAPPPPPQIIVTVR